MTEIALPLTGTRVLLIEDEPLVAMMLEEFVYELGGACVTASTPEAVFEALERQGADFAIVDVSLSPNGPDFAIADALADLGVRFVFSSGHSAAELPARHREVPFLSKPYSLDDLARAVSRELSVRF
jgi:DNA-binding NtrC family response regulator